MTIDALEYRFTSRKLPEKKIEFAKKHDARIEYRAAYQRDLRTIKRLGLNCTVAEFRKAKEN